MEDEMPECKRACGYMAKGNYKAAMRIYNRLLDVDPEAIDCMHDCAVNIGDPTLVALVKAEGVRRGLFHPLALQM